MLKCIFKHFILNFLPCHHNLNAVNLKKTVKSQRLNYSDKQYKLLKINVL